VNDNPTKFYFRQRQQNRLYDAVISAIEESARKDGIRKKDIATILGVPPSQVTRWLSGPANWTSDTTSDLLFSVGAELDFLVVRFSDRMRGNRFHPLGEAQTSHQHAPLTVDAPTPSTSARSTGQEGGAVTVSVLVE